jgi:hypothetical protein
MTILWSILSAVITSFVTTLVFSFFLHKMTDNAKKPWMSPDHQRIIEYLSHPNSLAIVQLPNAGDQSYEVTIMPIDYRMAGPPGDKQLEAFDEMVEQNIVLPVIARQYRLAHNYREKYRKAVIKLAYEEFGIKWAVRSLQNLIRFHKSSNSISVRG